MKKSSTGIPKKYLKDYAQRITNLNGVRVWRFADGMVCRTKREALNYVVEQTKEKRREKLEPVPVVADHSSVYLAEKPATDLESRSTLPIECDHAPAALPDQQV